MNLFGEMLRGWTSSTVPAPEVSVVTNGLKLRDEKVLVSFRDNPITLIVSFPTSHPEHYGLVMTGEPEQGEKLLDRSSSGLRKAMKLQATGELDRLMFHISPPEREIVRQDFPETINFLTSLASSEGVGKIEVVLFPSNLEQSGVG